jgi:hypothetical protein
MNRKILITLIIVNTAILLWNARNYILLADPTTYEVQLQIGETPPLAKQSLEIMESYTEEHKTENVNKIIGLYSNLVAHLDATKGVTLEAIDALYEYVYFYFSVSLINILLLFVLFMQSRHNK